MYTNRELFFNYLAQTSDSPIQLEIDNARGIYLYDKSGKKYIDLISGISVSILGHHPEAVVEAIKNQADKYMHLMVYGEYIQSPQVELAKSLVNLLPDNLNNVFFVNSGSEAIEGAMKLAKRFTQRSEVIAFKNAYHGSTHGALSIMGNEMFKNAFRPLLPDIRILEYNSLEAINQISNKTACVIIEPVQGEAGIIRAKEIFIRSLQRKCIETGTLLVFDEIQTGFGRTGSMFTFEQFGIKPDILTLAKGIAAGMPLGAFISSKEIMQSLKSNPVLGHITTFGGHPLSCAAGIACINTILNNNLINTVKEKEALFRKLLVHPLIKEIRSAGLLIALQMDTFERVKKVIDICLEAGLIFDWFLFCDNALRIAPPLIITKDEINVACEIILMALDKAK